MGIFIIGSFLDEFITVVDRFPEVFGSEGGDPHLFVGQVIIRVELDGGSIMLNSLVVFVGLETSVSFF